MAVELVNARQGLTWETSSSYRRMRAFPFFCCPLALELIHSSSLSKLACSALCCLASESSRLALACSHCE